MKGSTRFYGGGLTTAVAGAFIILVFLAVVAGTQSTRGGGAVGNASAGPTATATGTPAPSQGTPAPSLPGQLTTGGQGHAGGPSDEVDGSHDVTCPDNEECP